MNFETDQDFRQRINRGLAMVAIATTVNGIAIIILAVALGRLAWGQ